MKVNVHHLTSGLIIFLIINTLTACGGNRVIQKQTGQVLVDARDAYEMAKNNAITSQSSLQEAKRALEQAEAAQSTAEVEHLAYIAKRKAEIAVFIGERMAAESERAQLANKEASGELEAEQAWKAAYAISPSTVISTRNVSLSELAGKQTAKGTTLVLEDTLFETGKSDLLLEAMTIIDKVAAFLIAHPERNILIEGHTDNTGTPEYNMGLSDRRANAVRFALIKKGIASNRIVAKGLGETLAVASNQTAAGRKKNRRVEITILNPGTVFY